MKLVSKSMSKEQAEALLKQSSSLSDLANKLHLSETQTKTLYKVYYDLAIGKKTFPKAKILAIGKPIPSKELCLEYINKKYSAAAICKLHDLQKKDLMVILAYYDIKAKPTGITNRAVKCPLTKEELLKDYETLSTVGIGEKYNVSRQTVTNWFDLYKIPRVKKGQGKIKIVFTKELCLDYLSKYNTYTTLVAALPVSYHTFQRYCKKFGIQYALFRECKIGLFTKEILEDLYIKQNLSQLKISELYGCSPITVHRGLNRYGLLEVKATQKFFPYEEIKNLYVNKGYTIGQLAIYYNCNRSTVGGYLHRNNIKKRK